MQPTNNPAPPETNPFAFITDSPPSQQNNFLNNGSKKTRIMIVVGGLLILLVVMIIAINIFSGSNKGKVNQLIEIAKSQTEIIRLANQGTQDGISLETRSYASTIKLSMTTTQTETTSIIKANGVKSGSLSKQLSASKNSKSDEILDDAKKNNRYDSTFKQLMNQQLQNYQQQLSNVSSSLTSKERTQLKSSFDQASVIVDTTKN